MLQWGHVVVDVEGTTQLRGAALCMMTLQWGHVVVDVEGARGGMVFPAVLARFNGATSSSTWKAPSRLHCRGWGCWALQWGHVVVDVEGRSRFGESSPSAALLQWGHVVVDVEGRRVGFSTSWMANSFNGATSSSTWKAAWEHVLLPRVQRASMGPRRRRRGRLHRCVSNGLGPKKLQWGHVVVDVEGAALLCDGARQERGFNGATSSSTWKVPCHTCKHAQTPRASMGPRRRRRGRCTIYTTAAGLPRWCFNGATSSSTWKGRPPLR